MVEDLQKIKPVQRHEWKIWYNCFYFSGLINIEEKEKPIFIKVMDQRLKDCYHNEQKINQYIDETSPFLKNRKPQLHYAINESGLYIMVFDLKKITPLSRTKELDKKVEEVVSEYARVGIIHTDFGINNLGIVDNECWFFDYGTSLFYGSNRIRLRNGRSYNHIEFITETARKIMHDADFYYDDLIHYGMDIHEREYSNFIVSKNNICYVKLGEIIYKYKLEKMEKGSSIYLLCRDDFIEDKSVKLRCNDIKPS